MTTRQDIANGTTANDNTGDTLRQAAIKANANFVLVWQKFGGDSDNLLTNISFDSDGIVFAGSSYNTTIDFTQPTATRTLAFPDADGTLVATSGTQSLTNKTLNLPTIADSDGNEILKFAGTTSAVSELTLTNADSTGNVILAATGTPSNITVDLNAKGNGSIRINKIARKPIEMTANGTVSAEYTYIIFNKGTALAATLGDGIDSGEQKMFTNKGAGLVTVTPTNFAKGATFAIPQYSGANALWDGDNWYLIGHDSDVTTA